MKVNNLDAAMRAALIGTLILVMLCVISFGLSRNQTIPPQDTARLDSGQYVQVPHVPVPVHTQPIYMAPSAHPAAAPTHVDNARLASLEQSVESLANRSSNNELAQRLERIESQIAQIGQAQTAQPMPQPVAQPFPSESLDSIASSVASTNHRVNEIGGQLAGQMEHLSSVSESGMQRLNNSMQQVRESVSGLSGTVGQLDQSVASLHDGQMSLRQTVEQQTRPAPQVSGDSQQMRADVATLVNGMHELKSEIAGLKELQSRPAVMTPASSETVQPPVTNVSHPDLRPLLDPPAESSDEEADFLPLAPAVEEPAQPEPEPFPSSPEIPSPEIPSPDFAEPEILPQSATVPPAIPDVEIIEPATLETAEPDSELIPQPATLSPDWNDAPVEVPEIGAPTPEPLEQPLPVPPLGRIDLPAPGPISQMSFLPPVDSVPVQDDSGAASTPTDSFQFTATVLHVSANSKDVTARPGLVRLEDKGDAQALGHEAMVRKLLTNAGRHGEAQVVNSGTISVRPSESGRIAIGSPCLHCNEEHGVEAGDVVALTLSNGEMHVEALSPQRGVRVESVPLMQFDPSDAIGEATWLITEEAQEGSVSESTDVGDTQIEHVQRLVVITLKSADAGAPRLLQVPGVEATQLPAADFSSIREYQERAVPESADDSVYPAGYDRSNPAPRLLNPSTVNEAVKVPRRSSGPSQNSQVDSESTAGRSTKLNPLKMLRSVFDSRKAEQSTDDKSSRSRTGSAARGRSRR